MIEVQHHWAHCASLIAETGIDEMAALSIDGTGHGTDGNAWGGEVMYADLTKFDRLAHLQYIPLIGGEKALYDIRRLKFAIDLINGTDIDYVDDRTADVFTKAAKNSALTSSFLYFERSRNRCAVMIWPFSMVVSNPSTLLPLASKGSIFMAGSPS